jgi:hypothetical protein
MGTAQPYDSVAMLRDFPEHGVSRGDLGTVVDVHADESYEVEFVSEDGSTRALFAVPGDDCLPVHLSSAEPGLTGLVDGTLWYWYDPAEDVLDLRLVSKRSAPTVSEPTPDGFTLMREASSGAAIGLVVRGFWSRFGGGAERSDREMLERKVSGLASRLAA